MTADKVRRMLETSRRVFCGVPQVKDKEELNILLDEYLQGHPQKPTTGGEVTRGHHKYRPKVLSGYGQY